jgi:hypothetical protein
VCITIERFPANKPSAFQRLSIVEDFEDRRSVWVMQKLYRIFRWGERLALFDWFTNIEDDQLLKSKVKELGQRWATIARFFPGRSETSITIDMA